MNATDLADDLAMRWVFFYTRRLPARVAFPRRDELASDLWEHRHEAHRGGTFDLAIAIAIARRMVAGAPADLSWRFVQIASARGRRVDAGLLREEAAITTAHASRMWVGQRVRTRKCKACGNRYARRLPNCPVCKIRWGYDGIERDPSYLAPAPTPNW